MPSTDDGGPAFPRAGLAPAGTTEADAIASTPNDGMSLRDYFAAAAIPLTAWRATDANSAAKAAAAAYALADAMLAARQGGDRG